MAFEYRECDRLLFEASAEERAVLSLSQESNGLMFKMSGILRLNAHDR